MAKDKKGPGIGQKRGADYRASHRAYSAASAGRKKSAGFVRLSVWVPSWAEEILKRFAKRLCEGRAPDDIGRAQAGDGRSGGGGFITPQRRRTRKAMPCDDRQLDLFGPA